MFLDEKPFIWLWRPFYRRYGATIRRVKSRFTQDRYRGSASSIEELLRQQNQKLDELRSLLAHAGPAIENVRAQDEARNARLARIEGEIASVRADVGAQTGHLNSVHIAQWNAIEQLVISIMGSSVPPVVNPKAAEVGNVAKADHHSSLRRGLN